MILKHGSVALPALSGESFRITGARESMLSVAEYNLARLETSFGVLKPGTSCPIDPFYSSRCLLWDSVCLFWLFPESAQLSEQIQLFHETIEEWLSNYVEIC